ncbi:MAG: LacI family DNA-binding transcriptional regulator [Propionibacteriaceae bacterium]|nr:LacI family DNA-binding transcriptional regulator [Propionibacteriaceae bacterium]
MDTPRLKLADIAAQANTSVATVSKVLNGRPGVGADKRDEVLAILRQHDYRRRGSSKRNPAGLVDIVLRGLDTLWATEVLKGAEEVAARAGIGLVVSATHGRTLGNRHWLTSLAQRHSDGLVLVLSALNTGAIVELDKLRIPYVIVDPIGIQDQSVPVIGATNFAGGRAATEHLLELGHRRIGIITGERDLACSQERLDGYRAALVRAGVTPHDELISYGDFLISGGHAGAERFLDLPEPPTAIFAGSDQQAYGVYEVAKARGLRVPEDLSVVGFDDVQLCQWVSPRLTTVRQPVQEMAREATRTLLGMAYQGLEPSRRKIELATELVVRDSTAAPRRA